MVVAAERSHAELPERGMMGDEQLKFYFLETKLRVDFISCYRGWGLLFFFFFFWRGQLLF